jgi:hypothetical protein
VTTLVLKFTALFLSIIAGLFLHGVSVQIINYSFFILVILSFINFIFIFDHNVSLKSPKLYNDLLINALVNFTLLPLLFLFLGSLFLRSQSLRYGLLISTMMPIALVVPTFAYKMKLNGLRIYTFLFSSLIISPLFLLNYSHLFFTDYLSISIIPIVKLYLSIFSIPLVIIFILKKLDSKLLSFVRTHSNSLNLLFLCFLFFILSGNIYNKVYSSSTSPKDLITVLLLVCLYDFISYFSALFIVKDDSRHIYALSFSLKNVALGCGLLLFYDPYAAIVPALNIIPHIFLFSYIGNRKSIV